MAHMRLGMLGGTFDPVHAGHIALAEAARDRLGLDRVLLVPNACPPHKPGTKITPYEHRASMIRIALRDRPVAELCEVEREGTLPHYTIDTLRILKDTYGHDTDIFLIIGSDEVPDFPTWRYPERIVEEATVAVARRAGWSLDEIDALEEALGSRAVDEMKSCAFDAELPDVSSTEIRRRISRGDHPGEYVHPAVVDYIRTHSLYVHS